MGITSEFVREQKRYGKNEIRKVFRLNDDEANKFIKNLKAYGVLKTVKNNSEQKELSDLVDEDFEVSDSETGNDDCLYVFTYVGVITTGSKIIKSYPKYMLHNDKPLEEMKQILKVLERYGSKQEMVHVFNGDGDNRSFNLLAVILYLLNDYHEYGIYNNSEDIIEINGDGEILWDKTINESFALISNNRPYYMELYTEKTVNDEMDFIKRLHECILTECNIQMKNSGLLELFDMVPVNLSEETLGDLGDRDYILYRIHAELNVQFNTRKQILLKTLYAYVNHERTLEDNDSISMYGTNNFNLVWENVCAEVFDNKLNTELGRLDLPVKLGSRYDPKQKLIEVIEKPKWCGWDESGKVFIKTAKETLIPDLISIQDNNGEKQFIIFDAKYYNIQLEKEKEVRSQPGIGDITKQYLYQLAYKQFITMHNIGTVKNCFLIPTEKNHIIKKGVAMLDMLSALGLEEIQIRLLPATYMYKHYLTRTMVRIEELEL